MTASKNNSHIISRFRCLVSSLSQKTKGNIFAFFSLLKPTPKPLIASFAGIKYLLIINKMTKKDVGVTSFVLIITTIVLFVSTMLLLPFKLFLIPSKIFLLLTPSSLIIFKMLAFVTALAALQTALVIIRTRFILVRTKNIIIRIKLLLFEIWLRYHLFLKYRYNFSP